MVTTDMLISHALYGDIRHRVHGGRYAPRAYPYLTTERTSVLDGSHSGYDVRGCISDGNNLCKLKG